MTNHKCVKRIYYNSFTCFKQCIEYISDTGDEQIWKNEYQNIPSILAASVSSGSKRLLASTYRGDVSDSREVSSPSSRLVFPLRKNN